MMTFPVYQTKNENKILQNMVNDYSILVKIRFLNLQNGCIKFEQ